MKLKYMNWNMDSLELTLWIENPLKNFDVKQLVYILLNLLALHFLFHSILNPIKYSINYLCSGGIVNMKHPEWIELY